MTVLDTNQSTVASDTHTTSGGGKKSATSPSITGRYAWPTRVFHGALATSILVQLISSLVMHGPRRGQPGDWLFSIHQYSGLVALTLASAFWLHVLTRRSGTDVKLLFPWFSAERRHALLADIKAHWQELKSRRIPAHKDPSPLASAVHGLGLLLMLGMASTGAIFFVGLYLQSQTATFFQWDLNVHTTLASLVWAYLIAHAALAVLHHYLKQSQLGEMWSFKKNQT